MYTTTSNVTLTTNEAAAAGAVLGGMLGTVAVIGIAAAIIAIIAMWKIFSKAGEKGWKSLIPIYNAYILMKIIGMKAWFWADIIITIVYGALVGVFSATGAVTTDAAGNITAINNPAYTIVAICYLIFNVVLGILACHNLSKAFKRGIGTTLGLIFFPYIFTLILAFGSAKYDKRILKK